MGTLFVKEISVVLNKAERFALLMTHQILVKMVYGVIANGTKHNERRIKYYA